MLRYGGASMAPKKVGGNPSSKPWVGTDKKDLTHLPRLWSDLPLHLQGRTGGKLHRILTTSEPFRTWDVGHRYLDDTTVTATTVLERKNASISMLALEQEASLAGRIP